MQSIYSINNIRILYYKNYLKSDGELQSSQSISSALSLQSGTWSHILKSSIHLPSHRRLQSKNKS